MRADVPPAHRHVCGGAEPARARKTCPEPPRRPSLHPRGETSSGPVLGYRPRARVRHAVPAQRATWRYFLRRCRVEGDAKGHLTALAGTRQGLRAERIYVRSVLPRAVARELAGALHGRGDGLRRAGAIVVGLGVTTSAYLRTRALLLAGSREGGAAHDARAAERRARRRDPRAALSLGRRRTCRRTGTLTVTPKLFAEHVAAIADAGSRL